MSDGGVLALVEELEQLLGSAQGLEDPERLVAWNRRFLQEAESAERGPEWPGILARTREVQAELKKALDGLLERGAGLRAELEAQGRGERALRGYRAVQG